MKKLKIGVIGKGVVGSAVHDGLEYLGHDMRFFDTKIPGSTLEDVLDTDVVFVCVPTDSTPEGGCDTSIVESVVSDLNDAKYPGLIAIKSTVIPGTAAKLSERFHWLRICVVPEFLRARMALADFVSNHDMLVIGAIRKDDFETIKRLHEHLPKAVAHVTPTEAEIIKYFNNVNHSVQIIFANMFYDLCKKMGASYDVVYETVTRRSCFNPAYLMCNENLRGFGGHCLPKDTKAINKLSKELGLQYSLLDAILSDNEKLDHE